MKNNNTDPQWGLHLDKAGKRHFENAATKYGVEVYGATLEARKAIIKSHFDEPIVIVHPDKTVSMRGLNGKGKHIASRVRVRHAH